MKIFQYLKWLLLNYKVVFNYHGIFLTYLKGRRWIWKEYENSDSILFSTQI